MRALGRLLALFVALLLHGRQALRARRRRRHERIVPAGPPAPRAELAVIGLLLAAALAAALFVVAYALSGLAHRTQYLGLSLGLAFVLVAAALIVVGKHLVVTEENEEPYYEPAREEEAAVQQIVVESGSRFRRRRLLTMSGGAAAGALGLALAAPVLSLGPALDPSVLLRTPWRRGIRLVGEDGRPLLADEIEEKAFYTAFPAGASPDEIGAPLAVVRVDPAQLRLPPGREGWAPEGIVAYSKICTHAACAIDLYRVPTFPEVQPGPALVCPCHYSTFDPTTGGTVVFGPAGRPLPQLPLTIGARGRLLAGGDFSGPVGPSWWGVREGPPR